MRIGLFTDAFYPMVDGVIKVVDSYARRLMDKCEVTVFAPGIGKDGDFVVPYPVEKCHTLNFNNFDYSVPMPHFDPAFEAALIRSKLDLVHIHSPFSIGLIGLNYARLRDVPVVATIHSQYKQDFERSLKLPTTVELAMMTIMSIFNGCDECWTVNDAVRKLYIHEYALTAPCKVKQNATDHMPVADRKAAAAEVNALYGLDEDDLVLLFTGRINFIKNIDFIVRSLRILKDKGLRFKMLFVGQGQDEDKLKALVTELGLNEEVVLCGLVKEKSMLEKIYSRAKLFLFPSLYDANSLVQIEAACQSTPTLFLRGARTAGNVVEDVNGFLSDADEYAYADKIMRILSDEAYYLKVSEGAFRDIYRTWDQVVDDVFEEYKRLIATHEKKSIIDKIDSIIPS